MTRASATSPGAGDGAGGQPPSKPLPVVVLTTFFPSARDPHRTPFIRNLLGALRPDCALELVIPVPRRPQVGRWRDLAPVPATEQYDGFTLSHPRYLAVPGLHALSGLTYFASVWRCLRALRREHGTYVLHAHCGFPDAVGAALAARLLGLPLVVTVHGSDINASALDPLLRPQIRWALRSARRVVAVSRELQRSVLSLTGLAERRVVCIPCSGHAPEVFHPRGSLDRTSLRQQLAIADTAKVVLFVGHLVKVKGLDGLLQAWGIVARQRRDPPRLVLIGDGPERGGLMRLVEQAGLASHVSFLGPLPQPVVADWIAAADVLCLPSHNEGSPNVIVEALASGIPVVASRVGGIPDLVTDGVNGLLVPPADPGRLSEALLAALDRRWDPDAISASMKHLTWQALARRNLDALAAVASEDLSCVH
jgi:teichuronic acid biosynthesis glycosyltransferase TuaC